MTLSESIIIQINHLKKNFNLESNNVTKIEILTTIYLSGLVFHDYKENITFAEKELRKVINIFFDDNGFPKIPKSRRSFTNFKIFYYFKRLF